jgi:hypothetical protein
MERLSVSDGRSHGPTAQARFDGFSARQQTFILEYYTRLKAEGFWDDVLFIDGISGDAILVLTNSVDLRAKMDASGYCQDTWVGSRFHPNAIWSYREMASEAGMHLTLEPDGLVHVHFDVWPPDTWGVCHLPIDARHLADMFGRVCAGDPECVLTHLCSRGITIPGRTCPQPIPTPTPVWPPPDMHLPPPGVPWW